MSAIKPPTSHAAMISGVVCMYFATVDGVLKIPVPIMPPITSSAASRAPSLRRSVGCACVFSKLSPHVEENASQHDQRSPERIEWRLQNDRDHDADDRCNKDDR